MMEVKLVATLVALMGGRMAALKVVYLDIHMVDSLVATMVAEMVACSVEKLVAPKVDQSAEDFVVCLGQLLVLQWVDL